MSEVQQYAEPNFSARAHGEAQLLSLGLWMSWQKEILISQILSSRNHLDNVHLLHTSNLSFLLLVTSDAIYMFSYNLHSHSHGHNLHSRTM